MPKRKVLEVDGSAESSEVGILEAEKQERKVKALKNITKLLNVSERYSNMWQKRFEVIKVKDNDHQEREMLKTTSSSASINNMKHFIGELRPYQIEGVKWMETLFMGGINGILADEMGLGKTVQVIALFSRLLEQNVSGPYLIIAPLSTLKNWENEFARFAPTFPVVLFQGSMQERYTKRRLILDKTRSKGVKAVVLAAYHTILSESEFLCKISWKYVIIDEAQRIKSHDSQLSRIVRTLQTGNKILLTGTPLQNNMTELWSLLNFIMPQMFQRLEDFSSLFEAEDMEDDKMRKDFKQNSTIISTIHKVLSPFMLRRLKKDVLHDMVPKKESLVYCLMTKTQRKLYHYIFTKNVNKLKGLPMQEALDIDGPRPKRSCTSNVTYKMKEEDLSDFEDDDFDITHPKIQSSATAGKEHTASYYHNIKLVVPHVMFRKVVDHPYLISMPLIPGTREIMIDENLVMESGKMLVLDAMLHKLKQGGHKVLIFSTLVILLDLIEEFMIMRGHQYRRLSGRNKLDERQQSINEFNSDPNILAFLISTRAGGLGLNLTSADTVIFYDRDWNPQVDIQAQDRCHRIGQTKPVMVYTLIAKNTIDERVHMIGQMKRRLEKLIIKDGKFKMEKDSEDFFDIKELERMMAEQKEAVIHANGFVLTDDELEQLLDRSKLYEEMHRMQEAYKKKRPVSAIASIKQEVKEE